MQQRPWRQVPAWLRWTLPLLLLAQLTWHGLASSPAAGSAPLASAPPAAGLRAVDLGEHTALSKLLMLWLQARDGNAAWGALDYGRLLTWLQTILDLDPRAQYSLMAAARIYTFVPDSSRQRLMLDWIYQEFPRDPARRWPWMVHAAIVAKHRLGDLPLALKYSQTISDISGKWAIPGWARQMHIFLLQDAGDNAGAAVALRALLESGTVSNPVEKRFLEDELGKMRERNTGDAGS